MQRFFAISAIFRTTPNPLFHCHETVTQKLLDDHEQAENSVCLSKKDTNYIWSDQ